MITLPTRYQKTPAAPEQGGFGSTSVYKDSELERKVIIKTINSPKDIARLIDEIGALQIAKSKNVVQIYDIIFSDSGDEVAIVEEFLPGDDLINYRADPNNIDQFYMIMYQLSHGLMDIHQCGIVHRDFKCNNVKYDAEGILKIFDFGLAKYESLPASTVGAIGTWGFMAPELFQSPPIIDKPVDSYAFGSTAFWFSTGKPPGCALSKPSPTALNESILDYIAIDPQIATLINACLSINPLDRPTFTELNNAFKRELLREKHKGTLTTNKPNIHLIDTPKTGVRLSRQATDKVVIFYNGYDFILREVAGDVFVNSNVAANGYKLEGSSVITLGAERLGALRTFITFDVSHPEVVL